MLRVPSRLACLSPSNLVRLLKSPKLLSAPLFLPLRFVFDRCGTICSASTRLRALRARLRGGWVPALPFGPIEPMDPALVSGSDPRGSPFSSGSIPSKGTVRWTFPHPSPSLPMDRTRPKGRRGRYRSREFLLGSVSSRLGQRKRQASSLQLPSKPSRRLQKNSSESISRSWKKSAIHASIAHETVQEDLRDEPRSSTGEGNQTHNEPAGDWDPSRTCRH